jgi:hypothetical protein
VITGIHGWRSATLLIEAKALLHPFNGIKHNRTERIIDPDTSFVFEMSASQMRKVAAGFRSLIIYFTKVALQKITRFGF